MDQWERRTNPYPVLGSCDADGLRASQLEHAVQHADGDGHLGRLPPVRPRAQRVADHAFVAADRRLGMPCRDLGVDVVPVERAIGGDRADRTIDPVEQGADLRAVVGVLVGQQRRGDPAGVGVRGEVQLLPRPAPLDAVLLIPPRLCPDT